jgi:hypothetical protein
MGEDFKQELGWEGERWRGFLRLEGGCEVGHGRWGSREEIYDLNVGYFMVCEVCRAMKLKRGFSWKCGLSHAQPRCR